MHARLLILGLFAAFATPSAMYGQRAARAETTRLSYQQVEVRNNTHDRTGALMGALFGAATGTLLAYSTFVPAYAPDDSCIVLGGDPMCGGEQIQTNSPNERILKGAILGAVVGGAVGAVVGKLTGGTATVEVPRLTPSEMTVRVGVRVPG